MASGAISIRTWWIEASELSSISWRASATIETALTFSRSCPASSSISAGVASRPANMPKFTRTSSAGGACSWTAKAIVSRSDLISDHLPQSDQDLTLARLPAKAAERDDQAEHAPGGDHRDIVPMPGQ